MANTVNMWKGAIEPAAVLNSNDVNLWKGAVEPITTVLGTVKLILTERDGTRRESLTGIKWAWFDQTDPQNFAAPTDFGTLETTDAAGLIEVQLYGTALTAGQYGCLALSTSDNVDLGLYKLRVR